MRVPPSLLARKMLCSAYEPAPFNERERFRFLALHAIAVLRVIARHLKMGYRLKAIERVGRGYRIDLVFESPAGRTRIDEVKSSKRIREVHKIQAALYPHASADEIVVSNRDIDIILAPEYIQEIQQRGEQTRKLLTNDPIHASTSYTPHEDNCYICANTSCPFLIRPEAAMTRQSAS